MKICRYWNNQNYCSKKEKAINPDELWECIPNCAYYSPHNMIICPNCNEQFPRTKTGVVEIKSQEHDKCPRCCSTFNVNRDDKKLIGSKELCKNNL